MIVVNKLLMATYSLQQVSIFYLLIIAVLAWFGYKNSVKFGAQLGVQIGNAAGSALGAIVGVLISYQIFQYAKKKGMISY